MLSTGASSFCQKLLNILTATADVGDQTAALLGPAFGFHDQAAYLFAARRSLAVLMPDAEPIGIPRQNRPPTFAPLALLELLVGCGVVGI